MSLNDLLKHISAQQEAISQASPGFKSTSAGLAPWGGFRDSLWGHGLESFQKMKRVKRDESDPVDVHDVALPDRMRVAKLPKIRPKGLAPKRKRYLVRSEYSEAEQAAVLFSKSRLNVFVISGQPGIGKSVFLTWLLMGRLALKLPTALQIHRSYAILFHEGGVSEFTHLEAHSDYGSLTHLSKRRSRRIWALIDLNPDLLEPASIFKRPSPFFAVNAVPSRSDNLCWLKKISHDYFYMKPWSNSEALQARPFFGKGSTECQLWYLHKIFGASPRDMIEYAPTPDSYSNLLAREIANADANSPFHRFIIIGPSQDNRGTFEKKFASRLVFDLFWDIYLKYRTNQVGDLYNLFRDSPSTAMSARWIFGSRMHQLLTRQKTIQVFPILGRCAGEDLIYDDYTASKEQKDSMSLHLTDSEQYLLPEDDSVELQEGRYYRPNPTNFPKIDSLLLFHSPDEQSPVPFMFQITQTEEHDVNPKGLDRVNNLKFPSDACRYYVVVTPKDIRPKITVPTEYFRDKGQQFLPDTFPVFHYPVRQLFED